MALSTTEVEYMAVAEAVKETLWLTGTHAPETSRNGLTYSRVNTQEPPYSSIFCVTFFFSPETRRQLSTVIRKTSPPRLPAPPCSSPARPLSRLKFRILMESSSSDVEVPNVGRIFASVEDYQSFCDSYPKEIGFT
ncbi:hypothetical protein PIB30_071184 [Stylosanthes scabra]|uniref:Uncharacterized protein n=1 Tax=Stylosanthes scabra TaxID=79078 RepID=A0ABU6UN43_9FABA|nr:hypothetical protein [Stylosanthes scabra]